MPPKANTVAGYLAALPEDRRSALNQIRAVFRKNLDKRIVEHISYGMIGYSVPHSVYPPGYHCDPKLPLPYGGMSSLKGGISVHLFCLYMASPDMLSFQAAWKKTGKKLDMGKSCIRFKKIEDVPLDVLGAAIKKMTLKRFMGIYEASLPAQRSRTAKPAKKAAAKKSAKK